MEMGVRKHWHVLPAYLQFCQHLARQKAEKEQVLTTPRNFA